MKRRDDAQARFVVSISAGSYAENVADVGTNKIIWTRCWFIDIARKRTGSRYNAKLIQDILERQNAECAYTGETIRPEFNASLDHITPTSRSGSKDDPANLQWVCERINRMKSDFTHDEFLAMCQTILSRTDLLVRAGVS
jgi:5-methylcytosine-specific restriction endonuclease McrA